MNTQALFLAAMFLLVGKEMTGQTPRFEAGLQGGPSIGWLRGNSAVDETDALVAPSAGLTLQYNFSSATGIRLGAGYQLKGSSFEVLFTDVNGTVIGEGTARYELNYVNLPLMFRYGIGEKFRITAGAGGYAGVLTSGRIVPALSGFPEQNITEDLENLDLGICASLEGSLRLGPKFGVNAEVRYDKGLTNISALPVVNDGSIRTNAVALLAGFIYRFGGAVQQPSVEP